MQARSATSFGLKASAEEADPQRQIRRVAFVAGLEIPKRHDSILAGGCQHSPVLVDRHVYDRIVVEQCAWTLSGRDIPQHHGLVKARRRQDLSVRAEGKSSDRFTMPFQRSITHMALIRVAHDNDPLAAHFIVGRRSDHLLVGADLHLPDFTDMTRENRF